MFSKTSVDFWREETRLEEAASSHKYSKMLPNVLTELNGITEFCGAPGSGKTQLCLQLCVNVLLSNELNGIDGKIMYVDANQGFNPNRLQQIAKRSAHQFFGREELKTEFEVYKLLDNISHVFCSDYIQLISIVVFIKDLLSTDKRVKLLVFDSFSSVFKSFDHHTQRTALLCNILTDLQKLAIEKNVTVIITNELTTKISKGTFKIIPALGVGHSHKITKRILLSKPKENELIIAFKGKLNRTNSAPLKKPTLNNLNSNPVFISI